MSKIIPLFLILSSVFSLLSCHKTIEGNDPEVTKLVVSLVETEMKNQIVPLLIIKLYQEHPRIWGNPSYNDCKKAVNDKRAQKIVQIIDERVNSLNIRLKGIRTVEVRNELNKIVCEAIVESVESELYNIKYSAQLTDDRENIVVEILEMRELSE